MSKLPYPTWVEINLSAIEFNTRLILEQVKVPLMAVVKDNGYGHGAVEVSWVFLRAGGTWLAVARVDEGMQLRKAGISAPVLVLGGAVLEEIEPALANDLALPIYNSEGAELVSRRALALGKTARVHLKIDTGMGCFGVFPEEVLSLAQHMNRLGGMEIEGVFSHFAAAGEDPAFTAVQIERFKQAVYSLQAGGVQPRWVHLANSNGILYAPASYFNLVRAGGILYGQAADRRSFPFPVELRRSFTWKAQLMSCKRFPAGFGIGYGQMYTTRAGEWIGVVPVGYGDGYQRVQGTSVLVGGKKARVVGHVCMDYLMVSLDQEFPVGAEVVLIGRQGQEEIHTEDLHKIWKCTNSGVELIHPRVPRIYINDES
jgi:alanine racemase